MFSHRTSARLAKALVILAFAVAIHSGVAGSEARADLINPTRVNDVDNLGSATFDITMLTAAGPVAVPGFVNWSVQAQMGSFDGGAAMDDVRVTVRHLVGVAGHAGEAANPNNVVATLNNIVLGMFQGPALGVTAHGPNAGHRDRLSVSSGPRAGGGSQLQIVVNHASPEPGSLILTGAGALGLVGYTWRRRKQTAPVCATTN